MTQIVLELPPCDQALFHMRLPDELREDVHQRLMDVLDHP